jgi:hypothetical protein
MKIAAANTSQQIRRTCHPERSLTRFLRQTQSKDLQLHLPLLLWLHLPSHFALLVVIPEGDLLLHLPLDNSKLQPWASQAAPTAAKPLCRKLERRRSRSD